MANHRALFSTDSVDRFYKQILSERYKTGPKDFPNALGEPDNYLEADPYSTPAHIVPEWYFLPFYAVLRVIPNKVGGILAMGGAIVMLFLYPLLNTSIFRSGNFRPIYAVVFWLFVADFCLLGWAGTTPVDDYFRFIGVFVSVGYFAFFYFWGLVCRVVGKNFNATCY